MLILEFESYNQILSFQKDKGPISSAVEATIEMEEEENEQGSEETVIPSLNRRSKRTTKVPGKFKNYQKWD